MPTSEDISGLVIGLILYQTLQYVCRHAVQSLLPARYDNVRRRAQSCPDYFVFPIGILLTAASTPICLTAFAFTDASADRLGLARSMAPMEKVCLGSRAVLWMSELPLLSHSLTYVVHHILSISSLAVVLAQGLPLRPLYLIYAGLITELCSDTTAIMKFHGWNHTNSTLFASVASINAIAMLLLRALPAVVFIPFYLLPTWSNPTLAYMAAVAFYVGWLLWLAFKQLVTLGHVRFVLARPAQIWFCESVRISIFSVFFGLAVVLAQTTTAITYCWGRNAPIGTPESRDIAIIGLGAVVAGFSGAQLANGWILAVAEKKSEGTGTKPTEAVMAQAPRQVSARPDSKIGLAEASDQSSEYASFNGRMNAGTNGSKRQITIWSCLSGISVQGGVLFSAFWVLLSHKFTIFVDTSLLLASMGLSLPLGEAVGRVGCYFGGCCGSISNKDGRRLHPALQILCASLNFLVFLCLVAALVEGSVNVRTAGVMAVLANAATRLVINPLRSDARGRTEAITNSLAFLQLLISMSLFFKLEFEAGKDAWACVALVIRLTGATFFSIWFARQAWVKVVPQLLTIWRDMTMRWPWLSQPVSFVYAFSSCVIALTFMNDTMAPTGVGEVKGTGFSHAGEFLTGPWFLFCALVSGTMPVLLMSTW